MTDNVTAAMANLELSRELYSEEHRQQFYADYQAALDVERTTYEDLETHWRSNPEKWKFWRRASVPWKKVESELNQRYQNAHMGLGRLMKAHPLLVEVFDHKHYPLI